jgi:putative transposase
MADDRLDHRARSSTCRRGAALKRGADAQGLGRSRGGLSTKIHAAGDALGLPVRLIASPGQRNDIAFAHDLIEGFEPGATIADKGYDANHLIDKLADEIRVTVVIPPKRNRKDRRSYDADLYKERNIIERFFNKLKQFRRVATRYDKLLANFIGFVKLAAIAIWLK